MQSKALSVDEYIQQIPDHQRETFLKLRKSVVDNLPVGFAEEMSYGMIGYVVPFHTYPSGYHCDPKLPLPFLNIAVQKNFIAFYHMGLYANQKLFEWFQSEYPKHCDQKLDMGKSCVRFKNGQKIPADLIGELVRKIDVREWIQLYESNVKPQKRK